MSNFRGTVFFITYFPIKKENFLAPSTAKKRLKELARQGKLYMKYIYAKKLNIFWKTLRGKEVKLL